MDKINIDKTAPVLTIISVVTPTNQDVILSYSVNEECVVSGDTIFINEGNYTTILTATDLAGNTTSESVSFTIDKTEPAISAECSVQDAENVDWQAVQPAENTWFNKDVRVTFTASDATGVVESSKVIMLANEGANQSALWIAQDLAGNTSVFSVDNINIDKTAPVIIAEYKAQSAKDGEWFVAQPAENIWFNGNIKVIFTASDLSGLMEYTKEIILSSEGSNQSASWIAQDLAGNTSVISVDKINIDKTAPVISSKCRIQSTDTENWALVYPSENIWFNQNVQVAFSASDALSGMTQSSEYRILIEGKGQNAEWIATDLAGNTSVSSVDNINIDLTKSVSEILISEPKYGTNPVFINDSTQIIIKCTDVLSGVFGIEYSIDDSTIIAVQTTECNVKGTGGWSTGAHTFKYRSIDISKNIEDWNNVNIIVDKTVPLLLLSIEYSNDSQTEIIKESRFTITAIDSGTGAGIDQIYYKINDGEYLEYDLPFTISNIDSGIVTLQYKAVDMLGNLSPEYSRQFTMIDALAGDISITSSGKLLVWLNYQKQGNNLKVKVDNGYKIVPEDLISNIMNSLKIPGYAIVQDKDEFLKKLRSNSYDMMMILGEHNRFSEYEEDEIREHIYAGGGFIGSMFKDIAADCLRQRKWRYRHHTYTQPSKGYDFYGAKINNKMRSENDRLMNLVSTPVTEAGSMTVQGEVYKVQLSAYTAAQAGGFCELNPAPSGIVFVDCKYLPNTNGDTVRIELSSGASIFDSVEGIGPFDFTIDGTKLPDEVLNSTTKIKVYDIANHKIFDESINTSGTSHSTVEPGDIIDGDIKIIDVTPVSNQSPVILMNSFGEGKTVYFAFDLSAVLESATYNIISNFIRRSIDYIRPDNAAAFSGSEILSVITASPKIMPLQLLGVKMLPEGFEIKQILDRGTLSADEISYITQSQIAKDSETEFRAILNMPLTAGEYEISGRLEYLLHGNYFTHPPFNNLKAEISIDFDYATSYDYIISNLENLPNFDDVTRIKTYGKKLKIGDKFGAFEIIALTYKHPHHNRCWGWRELTSITLKYSGEASRVQVFRRNRVRIADFTGLSNGSLITITGNNILPVQIYLLEGGSSFEVLSYQDLRIIDRAINDLQYLRNRPENTNSQILYKIERLGRIIRDIQKLEGAEIDDIRRDLGLLMFMYERKMN
ncbi:hypothetical protein KA977_09940 [Candidatus Dependentiae bacterium]|nr:hypothetical protein [Candidatus Dependentiae bacterium]